jgi:hypothetical protein
MDGKHAVASAALHDAPASADEQLLAIQSAFTRPIQGEPARWNLYLLTTPPTDRHGFIARVEAMAGAVCSSGNRLVPASLIRELFALKHQGTISDEQLRDALHALVQARFQGNIPEDGMMRYLCIVGKAATRPDERASALKPLARALIDQGKPAQLKAGIGAASEYWPSWRKVDTLCLTGNFDQPAPAPRELTVAAVARRADHIVKQLGHTTDADLQENLRELAQECGDRHLSSFITSFYAIQRPKTERTFALPGTSAVPKRVFTKVVEILLRERDSIDQCVHPYERLLSGVPTESRLYRIAMDTLNEMLAKHGGGQARAKTRPPASSEVASEAGQPVHWHSRSPLDADPPYF